MWSSWLLLLQEMSVAAIAATAVSAGQSFLPYMAATCAMLGPLMTLEEEKMLNVGATFPIFISSPQYFAKGCRRLGAHPEFNLIVLHRVALFPWTTSGYQSTAACVHFERRHSKAEWPRSYELRLSGPKVPKVPKVRYSICS